MDPGTKEQLTALLKSNPRMLIAQAASLVKQDADAGLLVGTAHLRLKEYASAENAFREAVRIEPQNAQALYHVGLCAERQSRIDEAMGIYHRVLMVDPGFTAASVRLGAIPNLPAVKGDVGQNASQAAGTREQNRSQLWLPSMDEAPEFGRRLAAAKFQEFIHSWRSVPRWYLAVAALVVIVLPALLVGSILLSGIFSNSQQDAERLSQCQFARDRVGEDNLPPGCEEILKRQEVKP